MILGIGTDIVQIKRIERILKEYGDIFKARILSDWELMKLNTIVASDHAKFIAKRFAGKESVSKAFGNGIGKHLSFKDIEIKNNEAGKPYVRISPSKLKDIGNYKIDISLSDDYPTAIAFVVITCIVK